MKRTHQALFAAAAAVFLGRSTFSQVVNDTWIGGATGSWSVNGNWSAGEPNDISNPYNVFIDGGNTGQSTNVTLNVNVGIDDMTIDAGDQLTFANGKTLTINDASVSNSGTIAMQSSGSATDLILQDISFSGGGTIALGASFSNRIYGVDE